MEIVTIEKKTFEEMKSRFNQFSEHVRQVGFPRSCVPGTDRRRK